MTSEERALRKAEREFRAIEIKREEKRTARNEALRAAIAAGMTHTHAHEITGLTRGRIGQLGKGARVVEV